MACVAARLYKAVLMQRGFYATQDSCEPRDALRVADEQSFGLCVGFLLRLRRLAARVGAAVMTGHSETLAPRPVKGGFHPSRTSGGPLCASNLVGQRIGSLLVCYR